MDSALVEAIDTADEHAGLEPATATSPFRWHASGEAWFAAILRATADMLEP